MKPKARTDGLVMEELDAGLVVYDAQSGQAHWLDGTATGVWRAADGSRSVEEVALAAGVDRHATVDALTRLEAIGLLVAPEELDDGLSRRTMLHRTAKIGVMAAAAAPVISIAIPTAAAHASVIAGGGNCNPTGTVCGTNQLPCCSGNCIPSISSLGVCA